jgi:glutaredoxin
MTHRCPNCQYERKATDQAPVWQCPACGVAYAKVANSGGQANVRQTYVSGQSSNSGVSLLAIIVLALVVVGGFFLFTSADEPQTVNVAQLMAGFSGQSAAQAHSQVTLFATKTCGYCRLTREFFASHNIRYREIDIEASRDGYAQFRALGGRGVPVVVVGDDVQHGYSEGSLKRLLSEHDLL